MAIGDAIYEEALLRAVIERKQVESEFLPIQPCPEDYEREYLTLRDRLDN